MARIIKTLLKIVGIIISALLGITIIYTLIFCNPQFLFKYKLTENKLSLYSDEPISGNAKNILNEVQSKLLKSQIYNSKKTYKIFLCNNSNRFKLFSLRNDYQQIGGFCRPYLSTNVFITKSNVNDNSIFNSYGDEIPAPRTLSYVITHELTHVITGKKVGAISDLQLPAWINEGYSEYIAQTSFHYDETLEMLKSGMLEESFEFKSYYYDKYHLLISYLLDVKKVKIEDILHGMYIKSEVEKELKNNIEK
jgi:hypothetical protein